jgi:hypothetical protein
MLPWFANRAPSPIMLAVCGLAHEWARRVQAVGQTVRLLEPKTVRPFVQRHKADAADAKGIWATGQQPRPKFVPVNSDAQPKIIQARRTVEGGCGVDDDNPFRAGTPVELAHELLTLFGGSCRPEAGLARPWRTHASAILAASMSCVSRSSATATGDVRRYR